ncbi:hypothetical protein HAX54_002809 [Datura stramonium]|uniref:Uncharacterized protein n=1 Tax=Datura stramonium TaxID=4076 RepID=A0ABS8T5Y3_DATST|nr:hypothetical protein [Datura stramonium]
MNHLWLPFLLENVYHGDIEESGLDFNRKAEQSDGEDIEPFTTTPVTTSAATRTSSTTTPVTTSGTTAHGTISALSSANGDGPDLVTVDGDGPAPASANGYYPDPATADSDGPDLGPVGSNFIDEESTDYSTNDSVESEGGLKLSSEGEPPAKRGRGRPRNKPAALNALPPPTVPPAYPTHTASLDYPASSSAPPNFHASSSVSAIGKRGRGRSRGSTSSYKRPKVIGIGVFQVENDFKALKVTRSIDVTDDIGFKSSTGSKLKWNGKATISTRKLQEIREE